MGYELEEMAYSEQENSAIKFTIKDNEGKVWSREVCGGPHVEDTTNLGKFSIKKEQSSSAGVRRIKGVIDKYFQSAEQ